jgi:hypothetical protein
MLMRLILSRSAENARKFCPRNVDLHQRTANFKTRLLPHRMNYLPQRRQRASRAGTCVLVFLLTLAIGGHWAVLQATAWTTMLLRFSSETTVAEAVKKTFDAQHPCSLCKMVQKGKAQEKQRDGKTSPGDDLKLALPPRSLTLTELPICAGHSLLTVHFADHHDPPLRQPPRA